MSPETRALLREAAERGRFDHTAECSWHWRMDSACSCNAASIKSRLRAAADAGEDARNEDTRRLDIQFCEFDGPPPSGATWYEYFDSCVVRGVVTLRGLRMTALNAGAGQ